MRSYRAKDDLLERGPASGRGHREVAHGPRRTLPFRMLTIDVAREQACGASCDRDRGSIALRRSRTRPVVVRHGRCRAPGPLGRSTRFEGGSSLDEATHCGSVRPRLGLFGGLGRRPGEDAAQKTMSADHMAMMKAEMMKCAVCKNMAAHLDEIAPSGNVVKLNNGFAQIHSVAPAKRRPCRRPAPRWARLASSLSMTDEQAKTQLCEMCQGMREAMKAGAQISHGNTRRRYRGSPPPTPRCRPARALGDKCAMMSLSAPTR